MTNAPSHVTVRLRKPLERTLTQGHPWLWRDALEPFRAEAGDVATVTDMRGRFVARGLVDGDAIAVRLFSTRDEVMGPALLEGRVRRALELRERIMVPDTNAWRLLHGEGDRMPGFVCDLYGSIAVLALDGAGAEAWREVMVDVLRAVLPARGVEALLVRSGRGETRRVEAAWGEVPAQAVTVREHGMVLCADLARGQKTGLFLDQRSSRLRVRSLAQGLRVLNLYGYTGGFSVAAGLGGARAVTTVDVATPALDLARESWRANHLDPTLHDVVSADVMSFVGERTRTGARYDLVIADPPSFAPREDLVEGALKSYRALHAACLALLTPGGWYLAGSCSSHVTREAFTETVCEGAQRARRVLQVIDRWGAPADHPVLAAFGEGEYLKNVLTRSLE
jgi:23S rRNA (cytosine1962-C5)-methyltransferase